MRLDMPWSRQGGYSKTEAGWGKAKLGKAKLGILCPREGAGGAGRLCCYCAARWSAPHPPPAFFFLIGFGYYGSAARRACREKFLFFVGWRRPPPRIEHKNKKLTVGMGWDKL